MSDAVKKADRGDVESAIMDAIADARALAIVMGEAGDSPRMDREDVMLVPQDTFIAWQRMCNHLADSVQRVERVFYEVGQ